MKKRLLALLMAATISMALIACGGGEEEATTKEVATEEAVEEEAAVEEVADVEYTEEQQAFVDEYLQLCDDYDAAIEVLEGIPELSEDQEFVDTMNTLADAIIDVADICADPELLTEENMEELRTSAFAETYKLIDQINAYANGGETAEMSGEEALRALFTVAMAGADEAENTYWFLFNDDLTIGACVILSADYTQSVNVLGTVSADGDAMVITDDETGNFVKFTVTEEGEDYLVVAFEEGNEVTIINEDLDEAIEMVLAIDETTEILN